MNLHKYLIIGFIRIFSFLPFSLLYLISDFNRLIIFYLIGYRKKVVRQNLQKSFPDKTSQEIKTIEKAFYRNFCDFMVEFLKIRGISKRDLNKRIQFKNLELLDKYYQENKSVIACIGHCGNWEWMAMQLALISNFEVYAVVKPLNDKFFNNYTNSLRSKFIKGRIIPFLMTFRHMIQNKKKLTITIFATDQTPTKNEIEYWTQFLHQETPVYLGTEKIAKALDFGVVYFDIQRSSRGHYNIEISEICSNPKQTKEFEITEMHTKKLEQCIYQHPDNWLWSHRRWKHQREN